MRSRLYRCKVMHKRDKPKRHRFTYPCFIFCIDLDEVETLDRNLTFFGLNRRNLYSLRTSDHLDEGKETIRDNLVSYLRAQGFTENVGRIELVTNLRTWGYVFNPVSFYFVYDGSDRLTLCVAEVANTFNEQKLYLVTEPTEADSSRFRESHQKHFYISPFSALDTQLHFDLRQPSERISISITESDETGPYFYSSLTGAKRPLNNRSLLACSLRFPFMTLSIIAGIHWQALLLAVKRVPHFKKSHRPDLQTETRTYLKTKKRRSA